MRDYSNLLDEFWPTIMLAWDEHGDKKPIIECDVVNRKVAAWPSKEYIEGLSERTRESTHRQFQEVMEQGGIMVFIRDNENQVLQSHVYMPDDG